MLRSGNPPPASPRCSPALAFANSIAYIASLRELGINLLGPARRAGAVIVPAVITVLGMSIATVSDLDLEWFVKVCAGSQIPVYVAGLAAGMVVLTRGSRAWWTSLIATAAVALLLVPAGPFLIVPLLIAIAVLAADRIRRPRDPATPASSS